MPDEVVHKLIPGGQRRAILVPLSKPPVIIRQPLELEVDSELDGEFALLRPGMSEVKCSGLIHLAFVDEAVSAACMSGASSAEGGTGISATPPA